MDITSTMFKTSITGISPKWFTRLQREPDLSSRAGVSMITFFVVALPLLLLMVSISVNGLAFTAGYRRALALATIGVQTGAAQVDFGGASPALNAQACAQAKQIVCDNIGGCPNTRAAVSCGQVGNKLTVAVRISPPLFLSNVWVTAGMKTAITATVTGGPGFGINNGE